MTTIHRDRRFAIATCCVVILAFMASCRNGHDEVQDSTPSATVEAFNKAVLAKDYKRALACTDTRADDYELFEAWMKMMFDELGAATLDVVSEELAPDGAGATVGVRLASGKECDTLYLVTVRVGDRWRVSLVSGF